MTDCKTFHIWNFQIERESQRQETNKRAAAGKTPKPICCRLCSEGDFFRYMLDTTIE